MYNKITTNIDNVFKAVHSFKSYTLKDNINEMYNLQLWK